MVTHIMKTTLDISDALLTEARALAEKQNTTLRSVFEEGLRAILKQKKHSQPFRLKKASFRGEGLQSEAQTDSWDLIRTMIYEGRGG